MSDLGLTKVRQQRGFRLSPDEVMPLINAITGLMIDPELDSSVHFGAKGEAIKVTRKGEYFELLRRGE